MDYNCTWRKVIEPQMQSFCSMRPTGELLRKTHLLIPDSLLISLRNNQIARVEKSAHRIDEGRTRGMLAMLEDTLAAHPLPDLTFILSVSDKPISDYLETTDIGCPVFCFCKTDSHRCLLFPFARFAHDDIGMDYCDISPHQRHSWHDNLAEIKTLNEQHPWDQKLDKTVYCGHTVSHDGTRLRIHQLSVEHPNLIDSFASNILAEHEQYFSSPEMRAKVGKTINMKDYPQYKYLIYLDGATASDRLRYLLAFNSTVLKTPSPYYEFYYPLLEPMKHFVPVKLDLSDLPDILRELTREQEQAQQIARNGMDLVDSKLTYAKVMEYTRDILGEYAQLFY